MRDLKRAMRANGSSLRVTCWLSRLQKSNKDATYELCKAHAGEVTALDWGDRVAIYRTVTEEG